MSRLTQFFDRHMKTRIALQLVLDGLPFLIFAVIAAVLMIEVGELFDIPAWANDAAFTCLMSMMFGGGAILFLLGIWLRSRARIEFECYPWCKIASGVLRTLSFIPAVISFGFVIGIIVTKISNL